MSLLFVTLLTNIFVLCSADEGNEVLNKSKGIEFMGRMVEQGN